jgi:hypothetical protein
MGHFLLSIASAETISWIGFVILGLALVGEVGVILIPPKWEKLHKELAFGFAVLAAGGYAIERVGDEAIMSALQTRADAAEASLKQIEGPRDITNKEHTSLVDCLKAAPHKGIIYIKPGMLNGDAPQVGEQIRKIFDEAGGFEIKPVPQGGASLFWSSPGIFLIVTDSNHAPDHATAIQRCFWEAGRKIYGYPNKDHAPDTVTIGIGGKI